MRAFAAWLWRPSVLATIAAAVLLMEWPTISVATAGIFGSSTYDIQLVSGAITSGILVLSLNLAMGYAGLLSLVHTGLMAVGSYAMAVAALHAGVNPWLAIPAAMVATTLASIIIVVFSLRSTNLYFGLITLAFNLVIIQVARQWAAVTGGYNGLPNVPRPTVPGGAMSDIQLYYLMVLALGIAYLIQRNLVKSAAGRSFQAVRESPDTAASLGIDVRRARVLAFGLSGAIAGLGGALVAEQLSFVSPDLATFNGSLVLFIGLFLGGVGTLVGPLLGVALVTAVQDVTRGLGQYEQLILGVFLLLAVMLMPRGIAGTWSQSRFAAGGRRRPAVRNGATPVPPGARPAAPEPTPLAITPRLAGGTVTGPRLSARDVSRHFGGVRALDGVDIDVLAGEIHAIIGPNGAGKSTLVGCLSGFITKDRGEITLDGAPLPAHPYRVARGGVARVFQQPHLFDGVTVAENLLAGMHQRTRQSWWAAVLRLPGFLREERRLRREAQALLDALGLGELADINAAALSHGQKRLVEVARAIASHPSVLILDEPATGLTSLDLDALSGLLRALRERGFALLLIEHNMPFVMSLADRVTVLDFGRVIARGTPAEVTSSAVVREAYLGTTEDEAGTQTEPVPEPAGEVVPDARA